MSKAAFEAVMAETFGPTAERLLSRLLKAGCAEFSREYDDNCFYCKAEFVGGKEAHAPGCPYVDAVVVFGDPNAPDHPRGVLNA